MKNDNFWVITLLIIVLTLRYCMFCYSTKTVDGTSMYPTLHDGDVIYVSELLPHVQEINRGDIVGISTTINKVPSRIIKRVIGLPNEHVVLKNGKLYINDNLLIEQYIAKDIDTEGEFDYQLHDNQFIVLGDNRPSSMDSRDSRIGIINKKEIDFVFLKVKNNLNELAGK